MDRKEHQSRQGGTARILVEFLEVAITSVVFLKGIYPSGAFERRRYMNLVVQRACHPELRDYIHSAVWGLLPFIEKALHLPDAGEWEHRTKDSCMLSRKLHDSYNRPVGSSGLREDFSVKFNKGLIERVAVIFFHTENNPVERFMFKLAVNQSYGSKVEEADLEFSLRSFLIKLSVSEPLTRVLSHDCRWEITAYFRSLPETSTSKDAELWIPTDTKQWQQPPLITPIKSMSSEPLCVQLYLEHPSLNEPKP